MLAFQTDRPSSCHCSISIPIDEDRQLQEVLKLSQVDARAAPFAATGPTMSTSSTMKDDLSSPSGGSGTSGSAVARGGGSGVAFAGGGGEDPELAAAIALSLKHVRDTLGRV